MEHIYTDKEKKPTPKYKKGDEAWFIDEPYNLHVMPTKCEIKGDALITWFEGKNNNPSKWRIEYKYRPCYCERTVRHNISEEDLYATEREALQEAFKNFKQNIRTNVERFEDRVRKLGIDMDCSI